MAEDGSSLDATYHRERAAAEREAARRAIDLRARDVHLALARGHERAMIAARRVVPVIDHAAASALIGANLRAAIGLPQGLPVPLAVSGLLTEK